MSSSLTNRTITKKNDCRVLAAGVITAVINNRASLATLLPTALENAEQKDYALLQELCYGTLRYYYSLSNTLFLHLRKPLKEKDRDIFALLLLGAYQLLHTRIPAYAAINSSVNAAGLLKKIWAKSLINAVLRHIQRDMDKNEGFQQQPLLPTKITVDEASYDHPQWLINEIKKDYPTDAERIFIANNSKAPMTLRVHSQKIQRDAYLGLLKNNYITGEATQLSPYAIRLETAVDVNKLPLFSEGSVSIQDEAAQLCASLLKLSKNLSILDACAAPGGKTCHMLELEPSLAINALDIDEKRNRFIHENLQRLHLSAHVITADASKPETWWKQHCNGKPFDRILLDAPCSATGVIRHHPDIKLLRKADDIPSLAKIQLQLLTTLWPLLKPGGILLYTTCSILNQENESVIKKFLQNVGDADIDMIDANWGKATSCGRQLLPQLNGHDGFYFSRLTKKASKH